MTRSNDRGTDGPYAHWAGGRPSRSLRNALSDLLRHGRLGRYVYLSRTIPGWCRGDEAVALAQRSRRLGPGAVIVELGSLLGCSTVLLAGGRRLARSGMVHCVDPFDGSGDEFSTPYYESIGASLGRPFRDEFEHNIRRAGLTAHVTIHQGLAEQVARTFDQPVDLLFMDGDQSPEGVRSAFEAWVPHLKVGGILAVHSSTSREPGHDGSWRLATETVRPPQFADVHLVRTTTFGRKT